MMIKKNSLDIIAEVICIAVLAFTTIYVIFMYIQLPDKIPVHYNASGIIDRYGSKIELFILLVVAWGMYLGLSVVAKFPQTWNTGVTVTAKNKDKVYRITKNMLKTVKMEIVMIFCYIAYNTTKLENLPSKFMIIFLGIMFSTIILFAVQLLKHK